MTDERPSRALMQRAQRAVFEAVRRGELVRPRGCTRCPNVGKVDAHHFMGYEPEHWLTVLWLCRSCHMTTRQRRPLLARIASAARARRPARVVCGDLTLGRPGRRSVRSCNPFTPTVLQGHD